MASQTELSIEFEDENRRLIGQTTGYVWVSRADLDPARQYDAIGLCDRVFEDRMSSKSRAKRKGLADLIGYVCEDDTVRVAGPDRLGRSLHALVDELAAKGCSVEFVVGGITVSRDCQSPTRRCS